MSRPLKFDQPPAAFEAFREHMMHTFAEALGHAVSVDDRCPTDELPHWATVNGETRYDQCVTDALLLGIYPDDAVTSRPGSPVSDTELVVECDADGLVAAPEDALLSFGVERSVAAPAGPVRPAAMYERFCPYSKAFASREQFEQRMQPTPRSSPTSSLSTSRWTCRHAF